MFIGHFGVGLGAKRVAPAVSLGALLLACQLADLLWPVLVLAGVERFSVSPGITRVTPLDFTHYPWSHSLLMLSCWGVLLALLYRLLAGRAQRAVPVLIAVVVSHWLLDYIVHRPDLPLAPGTAGRYGLDLWQSLPATLLVEFALFAGGAALYLRATVARDRVGSVGLWALLAFLAIVEVANVFGPPPPSTAAVSYSALAMWLIVLWGYWVDRHRRPVA